MEILAPVKWDFSTERRIFVVKNRRDMLMRRIAASGLLAWFMIVCCWAMHRHWTSADGLPTGEVQQLVELPNGQMLVNCEGVFCLSNGAGFDIVPCDYGRTYQMASYAKGYGRMWQGDSLLWLHDFYRIYLFDARILSFRYDIEPRLNDDALQRFVEGELLRNVPDDSEWRCIDSLGLAKSYSTMAHDRQGALWIGTRNDGIVYVSPRKAMVDELSANHPLIGIARSTIDDKGRVWRCKAEGLMCEENGKYALYNIDNVRGLPYNRITFIQPLRDSRYLLCDSLSTLGYFLPESKEFVSLNAKIPALYGQRHFVGACPVDERWTVVYAQNGVFMLDTENDTLARFSPVSEIERYATKYNCMLKDREGRLWVGTQNGLFVVEGLMLDVHGSMPAEGTKVQRVEGLRNHCIRSLVLDGQGHVWAGTSCGVSRVTPSVVNLGEEDGIPAVSMMERAACLAPDGRLVFVLGGTRAVAFSPKCLIGDEEPLPVVITSLKVNDKERKNSFASLTYLENQLVFQFSTLDYATPSHNRYRYRLYPLEQEWNMNSDGRGQATASYVALPPGSYRFEVQSATPAGKWGQTTMAVFDIHPPIWLTWWAKTGYVLLGLAGMAVLIVLYLKRRQQQLERRNEERVNRLFELRDEARHQFAQSVNIDPQKITANKEEEMLVEKMLKAIGQNMDNMDYTVDLMATDIGMSRANLYKKTQQMLGITPNEFLRNVRLKHAAKLLADTSEPVNQISLMVGFQTSRYFSQCFRQLFGVTPSEYRSGERLLP